MLSSLIDFFSLSPLATMPEEIKAGGYGGLSDIEVGLRVDDHVNPVPELSRLLAIHHLLFDSSKTEDLIPFSGEPAARLRGALNALG